MCGFALVWIDGLRKGLFLGTAMLRYTLPCYAAIVTFMSLIIINGIENILIALSLYFNAHACEGISSGS